MITDRWLNYFIIFVLLRMVVVQKQCLHLELLFTQSLLEQELLPWDCPGTVQSLQHAVTHPIVLLLEVASLKATHPLECFTVFIDLFLLKHIYFDCLFLRRRGAILD